MAFCKNCGSQIDDGSKFCSVCGASQESTEQQQPSEPIYTEPVIPKASGILNVGMLVWSIIDLIMCCVPLGIVSLIMTIMAQNAASAQEEASKLKTAKICNLIGTIATGVLLIIYIVLIAVGFAVGLSEGSI